MPACINTPLPRCPACNGLPLDLTCVLTGTGTGVGTGTGTGGGDGFGGLPIFFFVSFRACDIIINNSSCSKLFI